MLLFKTLYFLTELCTWCFRIYVSICLISNFFDFRLNKFVYFNLNMFSLLLRKRRRISNVEFHFISILFSVFLFLITNWTFQQFHSIFLCLFPGGKFSAKDITWVSIQFVYLVKWFRMKLLRITIKRSSSYSRTAKKNKGIVLIVTRSES